MSPLPKCRNRLILIVLLVVGGLCPWSAALEHGSTGEGEAEFGGGWEVCQHGKLEHASLSAAAALDADTGRDLRNFPPDRLVDYVHMKLEMRFEDLGEKRFTAKETLTVRPIGAPTQSLKLDAIGLDIHEVTLEGRPVEHFVDDEHVTLRFDPLLPVGSKHRIEIRYTCDHPYTGMFFTPYAPEAPDYTAEVHTQGQTETNRHWFAAHDSPNERMSTELIVDVPAEFMVSSNGRLVSSRVDGDRAIWHWLQEKPHVSYLVTLVIGQFDVVEIPHDRVPMRVWVPRGLGHQVMQTYGRTGKMIDLFERRFGVPYPWDRYDQLVVKNFNAGGMENTSATSMYPSAILDETALLDRDLDGLIAHELAHQWTGDLITCKSWADIWLNEGWATFGAALWREERDGEDGYLDAIRGNFGVAERDKTTNDLPMVSPVYDGAWEVFRRAANPYPKGSSILHMLRMMLGEEVFWEGVQVYMNGHQLGVVETDDFRYAMEEVSGLGWFFDQWCYRPGTPELDVHIRYDGATRDLHVTIDQTQKIDERTPAFRFTLPVHVITANGDQVFRIDVDATHTDYRATLDASPVVVAVDPYLHVLKTMTVDKPVSMWVAQIEHGPTIAARHAAVAALGEHDSPEHVARLAALVRDETQRHTLRSSAVRALAGYGSSGARSELLLARNGVEDARVRARLVGVLDDIDAPEARDLLVKYASSDASYATRQAAIRGLTSLEAKDTADLMVELTGFKSQHDGVREAALRALAKFDDPRGLDLAMQYAAYGHLDRSRPSAIGAIGDLAHHDADRAVSFLLPLLEDPEQRSARAAAALADIGDERAVEPLRAMAKSHPNPRVRIQMERLIERMENGEGEEGGRGRGR